LLLSATQQAFSQVSQPLIPAPVSFKPETGKSVSLQEGSPIWYPERFKDQAMLLRDECHRLTGVHLALKETDGIDPIPNEGLVMWLDTIGINRSEMYRIMSGDRRVLIQARDIRGFVYAIQSLIQLLPADKTAGILIPAVTITDYPQFSYRGMHLDVVRHIFPVGYIKKYIDYLAFHKFNTFHWHLTDDQGWRWEVSSYPRLNSIGSWRDSTLIGHFRDTPARYDRRRYGGFYTKAEIRDIIAYAAIRGIDIIPELDIPGHSRATIAAYPAFSTKPDSSWTVAYTWGMYNRQNNVLAPHDTTFRFLSDIFTELTALFPSAFIHLGGDECSKMWWKQDSATQRFMRKHNLKNETALQTYFIEYAARHLGKLNRVAVGWHEIAEGDLDTSTLIMNWSDDKQALTVAKKGFRIIQTPGKPFYFDHYQSKDPADSLAIHGYNSLEAVYNYAIIPPAVRQAGLAYKIIGAQANVWTEYMETPSKVDYMIFPRMTALSENLWSETKNYPDFLRRLDTYMVPRYQQWNSSWFKNYRIWTKEK
jgi:hexosaminidase